MLIQFRDSREFDDIVWPESNKYEKTTRILTGSTHEVR